MITKDEAIERYIQRFGAFPVFLFMGAEDEEIIKAVEKALKTGEKIKPEEGNVY